MTTAELKKLLNKNSWTGRELGILEVSNMAIMYQQIRNEKPQKPLVENSRFLKMLGSITDHTEIEVYNGYIAIHEWLRLHYNMMFANEQQADLRFNKLIAYIDQASLVEDFYQYLWKLPVIMTEKQYKDTIEQRQHHVLKDENKTYERPFSGLAIIKEPETIKEYGVIDERGYYIPPKISSTFAAVSLERFTNKSISDEVVRSRELLLDSYYFIKGFNTTIDLIAKYYDLPAIKVFKHKIIISGIEAMIDILNNKTSSLYQLIRYNQHENEVVKQKKLKVLEDLFPKIDYKRLKISKSKIEQVQSLFSGFQFFKDDNFSSLLLHRSHTEKKGGCGNE